MEKEAFTRSLHHILSKFKLDVSVVSTDRHRSIKCLMRTDKRFKHIEHQFDPWHIAKGLLKKIMDAAKKKGNSI